MNLPKSITPCPIIDALVEIRFEAGINSNAVFGVVYNELKEKFEKVETLPILQLPEAVRTEDPKLKYKAYYKISNPEFVVQIGPDVMSISSFPKYVGWERFALTITEILNKVERTPAIKTVRRVGMRYINFFPIDIYPSINLIITKKGADIPLEKAVFKTEIKDGDFSSTLQIANQVSLNKNMGSIIDIDTSTSQNLELSLKNKEKIINQAHTIEKKLFFELLKDEFLQTLQPKYE